MREREVFGGPSHHSDTAHYPLPSQTADTERRTLKPDSYFSDEDASE